MTGFSVQKAAGALGAYVEGVEISSILSSDSLFKQLKDLAVEHEVIFLRNQPIEASTYQAFAQSFGPVLDHPAYAKVEGAPMVQVLESTQAAPSKIEVWHSDMTFMAQPPSFTLLHGQVIPAHGGDTLWASATAAYEGLSQPMQDMLGGLHAVHDFKHGFAESLAEEGGAERLAQALEQNPAVEHPVVRTHPESGRRGIYVNALFTTHIAQLTRAESNTILEFLYAHIVAVEHTVRLSWQPGTIAVWDNRSTQHKPVNDFFPQHRRMHRVTIQGDQPG